ncbi:cadmium-translocating P-type ATPase [Paenisporosarcina quisquiliarum]|uniref:Cd(2+)-exporting ATPase n=1 Tax=Paenisporosarcina quisquiliarum TaxID=365346 RepID=A0A9X3RCS6_9BACL|nr:heavy metal translocating P-type ATPase [Paenisporosarcina quisquiliarum]MCZ8536746.1 cadmium-translocating P-type ATPase [Paenisporosarcina quisquiliarum]
MKAHEQQEFRLENLTCANCAMKFEKNIQALPDVTEANVNFGASKVRVIGPVTVEDLEKAGAFDGIKVVPMSSKRTIESKPFFKQKENVMTLISLLFLVIGTIISFQTSEADPYAILFFALSIVVGGYEMFWSGLKNLSRFYFDMKTLMTIAIIGAAIIGEWREGAVVVFLFAVSEALEAYSMNKARQSIRQLMDIAPARAVIRRNNEMMELGTEEIIIGDTLIVKSGQKIAMDGEVISGQSSVNQAPITGESMPVKKAQGDEVFAGTLNEEGALEVRVTKRVEDTTIAKIIHLVEEAQAEKAPSQKFVDQFAKYYTPIIILIALLVAVIPPLFTGDWQAWIYQGLAVLVVGCPCALVVSTPVAIVTAIGNAAKQGVLIKGGIHLEEMGRLQAIAFDKTGTLTKGYPEVTDLVTEANFTKSEILQKVASVESYSDHPLARAIVNHAASMDVAHSAAENFHSVTGKGAKALVDGIEVAIGSLKWAEETTAISANVKANVETLQKQGKSVMVVLFNSQYAGHLAVADAIRESSPTILMKLRELGMKHIVMLTGDHPTTAVAIGQLLNMTDVRAGLMPEEKLEAVKSLRNEFGRVAMVGDGMNDAPALAAASVGIAMGGAGTDAALETADVALMADDLEKLPYTIQLSRKALRIIKENIMFALGLKIVALLLIIPGWLTLWIAIFADMGATLLVVLNSMRLLRIQK